MMKVKDFIKELEKLPPDSEIGFHNNSSSKRFTYFAWGIFFATNTSFCVRYLDRYGFDPLVVVLFLGIVYWLYRIIADD